MHQTAAWRTRHASSFHSWESKWTGTPLLPAVEQLERTAHQMQRMEALVNDLVDVSRIQAGKLELRPEQVDLVAVVYNAVAAQREAEARQRGR